MQSARWRGLATEDRLRVCGLICRHTYLEHRLDEVDVFLVLDSDAGVGARAGDSHGVTADKVTGNSGSAPSKVSLTASVPTVATRASRAASRAPIPKYHHGAIEADIRVCCDLIPVVSLWRRTRITPSVAQEIVTKKRRPHSPSRLRCCSDNRCCGPLGLSVLYEGVKP